MSLDMIVLREMPAPKARQRGVVLFIALIVMVVMSLAAVALMRSVDTTSAVIGNLAFRQASVLPANFAIEDAGAGVFDDVNPAFKAAIPDVRADFPGWNYYATHNQAWDDQYGIPQPLQTRAAASALTRKQVDGAGNTISYVVERMCNPDVQPAAPNTGSDGTAAPSWCDMEPPKTPPGGTINDPLVSLAIKQPYYRVTVRVDGPVGTNTVSFAHAMLK